MIISLVLAAHAASAMLGPHSGVLRVRHAHIPIARTSLQPCACAVGQCTSEFAGDGKLAQADIDELFSNGFVVVDGAFSDEEVGMVEMAMDLLDDGYMLQPEQQAGRDDAIRFVDEAAAMLPIANAMRRLKGFGESLQSRYATVRGDGGGNSPWTAHWNSPGEVLEPREPATPSRLLTAAQEVQLAAYATDGGYCVHSDNSRDEDGKRRNERALTCIVYATAADWTADGDGGCLRIWPNSDEVDCNTSGPDALGEQLRAEGAPHVDIVPVLGRVVIFRSTLLHEVLPTKSRKRRAITQWFYSPQTVVN